MRLEFRRWLEAADPRLSQYHPGYALIRHKKASREQTRTDLRTSTWRRSAREWFQTLPEAMRALERAAVTDFGHEMLSISRETQSGSPLGGGDRDWVVKDGAPDQSNPRLYELRRRARIDAPMSGNYDQDSPGVSSNWRRGAGLDAVVAGDPEIAAGFMARILQRQQEEGD